MGRLLLRLVVGGFFFGHGTQKLFGWFGGHGLDATATSFESMGLYPGRRNAIAAGAAEAGGGILLAAGAETPLAAAALTSTMLTAVHRVHGKNGPWLSSGGWEYNAVLVGAVLSLAETGPGAFSLDRARGRVRAGTGWALGTLLLGAAGSAGAHLLSEWSRPAEPPPGGSGSTEPDASREERSEAGTNGRAADGDEELEAEELEAEELEAEELEAEELEAEEGEPQE